MSDATLNAILNPMMRGEGSRSTPSNNFAMPIEKSESQVLLYQKAELILVYVRFQFFCFISQIYPAQ